MRDTKFLKNEKGSITLFVLLSCLFFLVIVTSVGVYLKNKESAVDKQYQQIKQSYEQDVGKEEEIWENIKSNTETAQYKYLDSNGNEVKVEEPVLMGNMELVNYDEYDNGETTGSKWANAKTADGSLWVWIPRYAYKITSGYHTSTAGTIEIMFLDTNNNPLNGEDASTTATETSKKILTDPSQVTYIDDAQNEWLVHPAFTSSAANGGGFGEIAGFWFAKFETSGSTTVGTGFQSLPGVSALRSEKVGNFYTYARQQLYGETGEVDSYDGYTSFGQSHIVKNSEWGAVAYLSQSAYGRNGTKVTQNTSSSYYTGGTTTLATIYGTNAVQSTTGNAYGIYDMSGGSWEYVASYVNNGNSNLSSYGGTSQYNLYGATATERSTSTKYKTVYVQGSSDSQSNNYTANAGVKGDAVYETSSTYSSSTGSWHSAYASFPYSSVPFFGRSGIYGSINAGVFFFGGSSGGSNGYISCRLALVP